MRVVERRVGNEVGQKLLSCSDQLLLGCHYSDFQAACVGIGVQNDADGRECSDRVALECGAEASSLIRASSSAAALTGSRGEGCGG